MNHKTEITCEACGYKFTLKIYDHSEPVDWYCPVCYHVHWTTITPKEPKN